MATPIVATLATANVYHDLSIFLKTIAMWQSPPTVYLYCDSELAEIKFPYPGKLIIKDALSKYSGMNRWEMEKKPGVLSGKSLWLEFQMEKMALLEWALESEPDAKNVGVFYMDSDICHFGPIPFVPEGYDVALSNHEISRGEAAKHGKYNGGYLWTRTVEAVRAWRDACPKSRFHEQAALEVFDSEEWSPRLYQIPVQNNYGSWRMFQADTRHADLQRRWSIFRNEDHSGILVEGLPVRSVHTHWKTTDISTSYFNDFVLNLLKKVAPSHAPARKLLNIIRGP